MSTPESRTGHPETTTTPPATERAGRFQRDRTPTAAPPPGPPPARDWRDTVMSASGLNALIGIWLIIAGFVLYGAGDAAWNAWWVGGAVLILGVMRAAGAYWQSWMSYLAALIGAWLFIASWALESSGAAFWNDLACGAAIFILAVMSASATEDAKMAATPWYRR